jgi:hypothetical protein
MEKTDFVVNQLKGNIMRKKIGLVSLVLGIIIICGICVARPVQIFSYKKMASDANLVVIATPIETKELDERTELPGVRMGNEPIRVIGLETTFEVSVCFRGKLEKAQKSKIVLHHYRLVDSKQAEAPNAVQLLNFKPSDRRQYLMFLKRTSDGRYKPYNGQTDPVHSIERLRNPRGLD